MENMDLIFAENNEIIVDALARMIRDQCEEIEDLQHSIERLNHDLREANKLNEMLKADMALAKKGAKVAKESKELKVIAPTKRKPGRPKKVVG
jgi:predicted RNase H-like nuclease (RuvC/YqgF family)